MAWIELHQTLWTHKKTIILATELEVDEISAAAHMARLWCWALDNAPDGSLAGLPNRVIAFGAGWNGDADKFVYGALAAQFMDETDDGVVLHDWMDYAGRLIEKREQNAERMREKRAKQKEKRASNVQRTVDARAGATVPNRTKPNNKEKELKELTSSSDEGHSRDSPAIEIEYLVQTSLSDGAQIVESGNGGNASAEKSDEYPKDFETFWSFYPRKVDKKAAFAKWKARRRKVSPDDLITASKNYAIYCDQNAVDAQYRMHAATFLGPQDRYLRYVDNVPVETKKQIQQPSGIDAIESYRQRMNGGLRIDSGGSS